MFELNYTETDIEEFVTKRVASYERTYILDLLHSEELKDENIDLLGELLTGELDRESMIISVGSQRKKPSFWLNIKKEIYKLICTDCDEYEKERGLASESFEKLVGIIATAIGSKLGIASGLLIGSVTLVLIGILKIGKNAWCSTNVVLQ